MNTYFKCSLCSGTLNVFEFKDGYVCEDCVGYIKSNEGDFPSAVSSTGGADPEKTETEK